MSSIRIFLSGFLCTGGVILSLFITAYASPPSSPGEPGVPPLGYFSDLFSRILVTGTPIGQVKNSQELDTIPAVNFQPVVTLSCPPGQWAIGVNADNTIKCL